MGVNLDAYPRAHLRLRDASYEKEGRLYYEAPEMVELPYVPAELCNHDDRFQVEDEGGRVCPDCVDSWLMDWEVWLPAEDMED